MFHHIVALSFKKPLEAKDEDYIVGVCQTMQRELPGVIGIQFVENLSIRSPAYTHAFITSFVDETAHRHYQEAPVHAPLKNKILELIDDIVVFDYET